MESIFSNPTRGGQPDPDDPDLIEVTDEMVQIALACLEDTWGTAPRSLAGEQSDIRRALDTACNRTDVLEKRRLRSARRRELAQKVLGEFARTYDADPGESAKELADRVSPLVEAAEELAQLTLYK